MRAAARRYAPPEHRQVETLFQAALRHGPVVEHAVDGDDVGHARPAGGFGHLDVAGGPRAVQVGHTAAREDVVPNPQGVVGDERVGPVGRGDVDDFRLARTAVEIRREVGGVVGHERHVVPAGGQEGTPVQHGSDDAAQFQADSGAVLDDPQGGVRRRRVGRIRLRHGGLSSKWHDPPRPCRAILICTGEAPLPRLTPHFVNFTTTNRRPGV